MKKTFLKNILRLQEWKAQLMCCALQLLHLQRIHLHRAALVELGVDQALGHLERYVFKDLKTQGLGLELQFFTYFN